MTARLDEFNHIDSRLNPEDHDSKRNFVSFPTPLPSDTKPQKLDEISIQLSFRFVCGNSFKVLIGIGLFLAVGWNIYLGLSHRDSNNQYDSPIPLQSPTLPRAPEPTIPAR
jgi:hypothetical protein